MPGAPSFTAVVIAFLALTRTASAYEPRVNYQLQCMGCHLANGAGESDRVPSLRKTLVRFSMLEQGREFVLRVPGVAQSPLSNAETAEVLNWMARNISDEPLPLDFKNYTPEEVGAVRARPLTQIKRTRRTLLQRTR